MPEGHTVHRLARDHTRDLAGRPVRASSPQGRFAEGAARVDGRVPRAVRGLRQARARPPRLRRGAARPPRADRQVVPPRRCRHRRRSGSSASASRATTRAWDLSGPMTCRVVSPDEAAADVAKLGPDPLRRDADPERFVDRVRRSAAPIGTLLLDQTVIAGIGNVYRAEVLWPSASTLGGRGDRSRQEELPPCGRGCATSSASACAATGSPPCPAAGAAPTTSRRASAAVAGHRARRRRPPDRRLPDVPDLTDWCAPDRRFRRAEARRSRRSGACRRSTTSPRRRCSSTSPPSTPTWRRWPQRWPGATLRPHVKAFKSTALARRLADDGHTDVLLRHRAGDGGHGRRRPRRRPAAGQRGARPGRRAPRRRRPGRHGAGHRRGRLRARPSRPRPPPACEECSST